MLGLILNAAVLWTNRYLDAAVAELRENSREGRRILDEDVARLSPLKHTNLNVLGRYHFAASQPSQGLRPLRDPQTVEVDEDDESERLARVRQGPVSPAGYRGTSMVLFCGPVAAWQPPAASLVRATPRLLRR